MPEYVTLADAKHWLQITDDSRDADVQRLIPIASGMVDDYCQRVFAPTDYVELYDGHGGRLLPLRRVPVISVAACTDLGLDKAIETRLIPEVGIMAKLAVFPIGQKNIEVSYRAGYNTIPDPVRQAVLHTISALFTAPALDQNLVGETVAGVFSGSFQPGGPGSVPLAAKSLLGAYRHLWHGST